MIAYVYIDPIKLPNSKGIFEHGYHIQLKYFLRRKDADTWIDINRGIIKEVLKDANIKYGCDKDRIFVKRYAEIKKWYKIPKKVDDIGIHSVEFEYSLLHPAVKKFLKDT